MIYQALGTLVAVIAVSVSSFFFGVRYESGQNAKAQKVAIEQAVDQVREDLKAQEAKAVQAAEAAAAKRYKAREVQREIAKLPDRTECYWTADEQRLLNDLYGSYFNASAKTGAVQDKVRQPTTAK